MVCWRGRDKLLRCNEKQYGAERPGHSRWNVQFNMAPMIQLLNEGLYNAGKSVSRTSHVCTVKCEIDN